MYIRWEIRQSSLTRNCKETKDAERNSIDMHAPMWKQERIRKNGAVKEDNAIQRRLNQSENSDASWTLRDVQRVTCAARLFLNACLGATGHIHDCKFGA